VGVEAATNDGGREVYGITLKDTEAHGKSPNRSPTIHTPRNHHIDPFLPRLRRSKNGQKTFQKDKADTNPLSDSYLTNTVLRMQPFAFDGEMGACIWLLFFEKKSAEKSKLEKRGEKLTIDGR
jgi:hypothetical protein